MLYSEIMFKRRIQITTDKCLLSLKSKAILNTSSESGNAIPQVQQNFLLAESPGLNELCIIEYLIQHL